MPSAPCARHTATVLSQCGVQLLPSSHNVNPTLSTVGSAARSTSAVPVLAVDAACVLPASFHQSPPARAWAVRRKWAKWLAWHARDAYQAVAPNDQLQEQVVQWYAAVHGGDAAPPPLLPAGLHYIRLPPCTPLSTTALDAAINEIVAASGVDHSVPPSTTTRGGSVAGMARWGVFLQSGIKAYAKKRNDIFVQGGVSGMSPYLHYGAAAATRLARDVVRKFGQGAAAGQRQHPVPLDKLPHGPAKWMDEFLTWREVAYAFCHRNGGHEDIPTALPPWAVASWNTTDKISRLKVFSLDALSSGSTGDALWDAAQRHLVKTGEMHNNLRMTWGKAFPVWAHSAQDALHALIDINHRFALDGRDPCSYAGMLWCFGAFDAPKGGHGGFMGDVREKTTLAYARRTNLASMWKKAVSLRRCGSFLQPIDQSVTSHATPPNYAALKPPHLPKVLALVPESQHVSWNRIALLAACSALGHSGVAVDVLRVSASRHAYSLDSSAVHQHLPDALVETVATLVRSGCLEPDLMAVLTSEGGSAEELPPLTLMSPRLLQGLPRAAIMAADVLQRTSTAYVSAGAAASPQMQLNVEPFASEVAKAAWGWVGDGVTCTLQDLTATRETHELAENAGLEQGTNTSPAHPWAHVRLFAQAPIAPPAQLTAFLEKPIANAGNATPLGAKYGASAACRVHGTNADGMSQVGAPASAPPPKQSNLMQFYQPARQKQAPAAAAAATLKASEPPKQVFMLKFKLQLGASSRTYDYVLVPSTATPAQAAPCPDGLSQACLQACISAGHDIAGVVLRGGR